VPSVEGGAERLRRRSQPGDVAIVLGAGDVDRAVALLGR
jgi:UDP-N-acetylmuramate-alanine ligase